MDSSVSEYSPTEEVLTVNVFKDTNKWRVSILYFDPGYWSIVFRVRYKPTGGWTYGRTNLTYDEKLDSIIVLDKELGGTAVLSLSPEDQDKLQSIFEEFEIKATHPRTLERIYPE